MNRRRSAFIVLAFFVVMIAVGSQFGRGCSQGKHGFLPLPAGCIHHHWWGWAK